MGTWMFKGKAVAVSSDPYVSLRLDKVDNSAPGAPRVLSLVSNILGRSIQRNEKLLEASRRKDVITIFHGSKPPSWTIRQYAERIFKYSKCSNSCYVVALIYIDRFLQQMGAYLTSLNVHRILITSVMVAAKFMDYQCYNNAYYAKVGGVSTEEMNGLEMKFLFSLDFRLHITTEVFRKYCVMIEGEGSVENRSTNHQTQGYWHGGWTDRDKARR